MNEMVNRIARALSSKVPMVTCKPVSNGLHEVGYYDRDGRNPQFHFIGAYRDYTHALTQMNAHQHQLAARTAIAAMREATNAMEDAAQRAAQEATAETGAEFVRHKDAPNAVWPVVIRPIVLWHAMIDEAAK